jgi:hypothetical protein
MRPVVAAVFPAAPGQALAASYLERVEEIYTHDADNSLSIEGFQVTPEMIGRTRPENLTVSAPAERGIPSGSAVFRSLGGSVRVRGGAARSGPSSGCAPSRLVALGWGWRRGTKSLAPLGGRGLGVPESVRNSDRSVEKLRLPGFGGEPRSAKRTCLRPRAA